jgi:hypothetical protein
MEKVFCWLNALEVSQKKRLVINREESGEKIAVKNESSFRQF